MKKKLLAMGLMVSAVFLISGCTTWNGITQTDKPGSYYVTTTFRSPVGYHTGMLLCTSTETGDLKCKKVVVEK